MSIALRIKELRQLSGLTQKEFSAKINIDNSQFSKIEQGKLQPTLNQLMEISSIFTIPMDELCFGKKNENLINSQNKPYETKENNNNIDYKELADSRREIIELLKEKVNNLQVENSNLKQALASSSGSGQSRVAG